MNSQKTAVVPNNMILPFILVTSLFALWGLNDITNPMVAVFGTLMELSNSKALGPIGILWGYATMAIPAAIFIRRFSYKKGILLGLGLYSLGALLFYPAARFAAFGFFTAPLHSHFWISIFRNYCKSIYNING